jgi:hypothetical protein
MGAFLATAIVFGWFTTVNEMQDFSDGAKRGFEVINGLLIFGSINWPIWYAFFWSHLLRLSRKIKKREKGLDAPPNPLHIEDPDDSLYQSPFRLRR